MEGLKKWIEGVIKEAISNSYYENPLRFFYDDRHVRILILMGLIFSCGLIGGVLYSAYSYRRVVSSNYTVQELMESLKKNEEIVLNLCRQPNVNKSLDRNSSQLLAAFTSGGGESNSIDMSKIFKILKRQKQANNSNNSKDEGTGGSDSSPTHNSTSDGEP